MSVPTKVVGDRLILSPREALLAGGPAEEFESGIQELYKAGYRHLVVDLRGVSEVDSAGIRSLVRGLTTAQRLDGSFKLVAPSPAVLAVLRMAQLEAVFPVFTRVEPALARRRPWRNVGILAAAVALAAALVTIGAWILPAGVGQDLQWLQGGGRESAPGASPWWQPFVEFGKLLLAAAIGVVVTAVHRRYRAERPQTQSMEQAQVLLCVSGALMMIIINGSVARAFGIAGAASIIRFRTPVEDPKDITILFLLMGLGMSAGVGAFGVAGLGTVFLCIFLAVLNRIGARRPRAMMVEVEAESREFPTAHVQSVFARNRVIFEPREVSQGKAMCVRYYALLDQDQSLESLSEQLVDAGRAHVKSVSWELPRKTE
jgi:anti-anti-sigma factor